MRGLVRFAFTLLLAGVLAAIQFAPQLGINQQIGVAQALAMRNLVTAGVLALSIVLLMVWAFFRGKTLLASLVSFAFVVLSAIVIFQNGISTTVATQSHPKSESAEGTEADLRILSWNTHQESVDPAAIAETAQSLSANVIALPETSPNLAEQVADELEGVGRTFTVVAADGQSGVSSQSSLLLDAALGEYTLTPDDSQVIPAGIIADPETEGMPRIVVAHAQQPGFSQSQAEIWRSHLEWYETLCDADDTVIAGDFNATLENLPDDTLGQCRSAAAQLGTGSAGTWPTSLPTWLASPIDQVYAGPGWTPTRYTVVTSQDDAGSDHRPIFVTLQRTADAE